MQNRELQRGKALFSAQLVTRGPVLFFLIFCTAPHKKSRKQFSKPWRQTAYFFLPKDTSVADYAKKNDTGEASNSRKMQLYRIQTVLPMTMFLNQVQNLNQIFQVQLKLF